MDGRSVQTERIGALLDVTDRMADRPSFGELLELLEELFVDVLRYERERYDVTRRAEFSKSARAGSVWSVAEGGGVRICAIRRAGGSFWKSTFRALFRLYPESIVFVWSDIDHSVRVYYRERSLSGKPYRSLLPHTVRGPRSEKLATWAVRFGLLDPDPREPAYVNYERFQRVMDASPEEVLEYSDPFRWENREEWALHFGSVQWWGSHAEVDERFLQPLDGHGRHSGGRRFVRGLHAACLRMFPMYVAGREDWWLAYEDYVVEPGEDGEWHVNLELALKHRVRDDGEDGPGEIVTRERFERVFSFPSVDEHGRFRTNGRLWHFRAREGASIAWDQEEDETQTRSTDQTLELDELDDREAEERVEEAEAEALKAGFEEGQSEDSLGSSSFNDSWEEAGALVNGEQDEAERPFAFLDPVDALTYGVGRRLSSLFHHLYNRSVDKDRTTEEHVRAILNEWWVAYRPGRHRTGRDRREPPLLTRSFWHEQFEVASEAGLERSELGRRIEAHAVRRCDKAENSDAESGTPEWACPLSLGDRSDRWLPVGRSVPHPVRHDFVQDPERPSLSMPARASAEESLGRRRAAVSLRADRYVNQGMLRRVVVRPGEASALDVRRDVAARWPKVLSRRVFERVLPPGRPISRVLGMREAEGPAGRRRRWRWVGEFRERPVPEDIGQLNVSEKLYLGLCWRNVPGLDPETGVVQSDTWVEPGQPLALRTALEPPPGKHSEAELLAKIFFGDEAGEMERLADRSWYVPEGVRGRVDEVELRGDPERDLWARVTVESPLGLCVGARVDTSLGIGVPVRALREREEMPFDSDGEPVDAVLILPEEKYREWATPEKGSTSTLIDGRTGRPVDACRLVRNVEATVTKEPGLRAGRRRAKRNLHGRSLHSFETTGTISKRPSSGRFSVHRLVAELAASGADGAAGELVRRLDGNSGFESQQPVGRADSKRARLRFRQLLAAFGLELREEGRDKAAERRRRGAELRLRAPRPDSAMEVLDSPAETFNYRTGRPAKGGLFDQRRFEPLPEAVLEAGDVEVERHAAHAVPGGDRIKHAGPITLHVPEGAGRGLAYIELPEPMLSPFAEGAVAGFFGIELEELLGVIFGDQALEVYRTTDGEIGWQVVERWESVTEETVSAAPEADRHLLSGAAGLRYLLEFLAREDARAKQVQGAFWDYLPVLPPDWRPLRMGDGSDAGSTRTSTGDTPPLSSDRNWLYVRVAHTVSRLAQTSEHSGSPVVLGSLRRQLRRKVHELYGMAGTPEHRGTPVGGVHFPESGIDLPNPLEPAGRRERVESVGLSHLVRLYVGDRLLLREEGAVPESIWGSWSPMVTSVARSTESGGSSRTSGPDVRVPARHLLDAWSESVAEVLMAGGNFTAPEAFRAVESRSEEAFDALARVLERAPTVGYLLSEDGAVEAVRVGLAAQSDCIEVSRPLPERLDLEECSDVLVFLPTDDDVRREADEIISEQGGISSRSVRDRPVNVGALEALARHGADEGCAGEPEYLWQLGLPRMLWQAVSACCGRDGSIEVETRDLYSSMLLGGEFDVGATEDVGGTALLDLSEVDVKPESTVPPPCRAPERSQTKDEVTTQETTVPEADESDGDDVGWVPEDRDDAVVAGPLAKAWGTLVDLASKVEAKTEVEEPGGDAHEISGETSDAEEPPEVVEEPGGDDREEFVVLGKEAGEAEEADDVREPEPEEYVVLEESADTEGADDNDNDTEDGTGSQQELASGQREEDKEEAGSPTRDLSGDVAAALGLADEDEEPEPELPEFDGPVLSASLMNRLDFGTASEAERIEDSDAVREEGKESGAEPGRAERGAPDDAEPARARLVVERNGDVGTEFPVEGREVTVGTFNMDAGVFPDVDLEEQDQAGRISDEHCVLRWKDGAWHLQDVGSEHGTSHNRSASLPAGETVPLEDGDEIIVGKLFLRFEIVDEERI